MPKATRLGDSDSGHDLCPPRSLSTASPNVFINGKKAGRLGDQYPPHSCPEHIPHVGNIASGSNSVYINGKRAARIGDAVSCGGSVSSGSPNVFIG